MSLETANRLSELTGRTRRTVKAGLKNLKPVRKEGRSYLYESSDALPLIFDIDMEDSPVAEKARLDKLRADEIEHRLQLAKSEVAPIAILEDALLRISEQICSILDSLPLRIKKRVPKLTAREIENIRREIVKAQNAASESKLDYKT